MDRGTLDKLRSRGTHPGGKGFYPRRNPHIGAGAQPSLLEEMRTDEVSSSRWHRIFTVLLLALFLLVIGAYFSPLGSLIFLSGNATYGCGGGSCDGPVDVCTQAADCDAFVVTTLEADGITVGQGDPTRPFDIYNENVTVHNGSIVTFAPGSEFTCPDPGFLDGCVSNSTAVCELDYAGCDDATPFTFGDGLATNNLTIAENATLTFAAGSAVTCPTADFLNACVDVGGATYTPTCDAHSSCTNFLVQGIDVVGGTVSLQLGADLVLSSSSQITVPLGAAQVFESGSSLEFQSGSAVFCPTPGFLNGCVDESASQVCATDYNQCNGADPFVVGQVDVNDGIEMAVGSTLEFLAGSAVVCPTTGFLNDCVDESVALACDTFAGCSDFTVTGAIVDGGLVTITNGADVNVGNSSSLYMGFGSVLEFDGGASVVCPTAGFLNDCVDEAGGGSFTPTCATDYLGCNDGDPFVVETVSATNVDTTNLDVGSGGLLTFDATSSVSCPTTSFLNACVDNAAPFTPTCATDYLGCNDGDPFVVETVSATNVDTTNLDVGSGGLLTFDATSSVSCPTTGFLNACVDNAAPFTPTCATDYLGCNDGDPFVVETVSATNVDTTNLDVGAGGTLTFDAASSVVCPTGSFLDACVTDPAALTCTDYDTCTDFEVIGMNVVGGAVDLLSGASLNANTAGSSIEVSGGGLLSVGSGGTLSMGGSTLAMIASAAIDMQGSSTFSADATVSATCSTPIFDYSSGCTSEPAPARLRAPVFTTIMGIGSTTVTIQLNTPDSSIAATPEMPLPVGPFNTFTFTTSGTYAISIRIYPQSSGSASDFLGEETFIELQRYYSEFGNTGAGGGAFGFYGSVLCQRVFGTVGTAPPPYMLCSTTEYFDAGDSVRFLYRQSSMSVIVTLGSTDVYFENLQISRVSP